MISKGYSKRARIRSTHPEQWVDDDFVQLSPHARLLALAVRNFADDNGVFVAVAVKLKMQCLPYDTVDVEALLGELVARRQVHLYDVEGKRYGLIRNFAEYQSPQRPSFAYPVPETLPAGYELHPVFTSNSSTSPGSVPEYSRTSPGSVPEYSRTDHPMEKEKEKEKEKEVEVEGGPGGGLTPSPRPDGGGAASPPSGPLDGSGHKTPPELPQDASETPGRVIPLSKGRSSRDGPATPNGGGSEAMLPGLPAPDPDPLAAYPPAAAFYPELRRILLGVHQRARLPDLGSKAELDDRTTLARLLRREAYDPDRWVSCMRWLFESDHKDAEFWRKQVQSFRPLGEVKKGASKMAKIYAAWEAAVKGSIRGSRIKFEVHEGWETRDAL